MRFALTRLALACVALALAACSQGGGLNPSAGEVPTIAENFQLVDQNRDVFELRYFEDAPAIVLVSGAIGDATSIGSAKAIQALSAEFAAKGAVFAMINSSPGATYESVAADAKAGGFADVRVLIDEHQLVGETLGVMRTGEAFVIDPRVWKIVYHGPMDDRFTTAMPGKVAKAQPVKDALNALLAGKPVELAPYETGGSVVPFPDRGADHSKLNYVKDIAPILLAKCSSCHAEGGVGPFAMTGYDVAKKFAPMMREVIRTQRMPPFKADPHVGQWKHDNSLSDSEIRTIVHWVEAGAKRGDGEDPLAREVKPAPEWPLGKPDLILTLPTFDIPASGVVDDQYPVVANPLKTTKWLRSVTIIPGDLSTVHHVLAGYMSTAPKAGAAARDTEWQSSIGSYAPGQASREMPDGVGAEILPGGGFGFQVHYAPNGVASKAVTRVGLYFHDKPPKFVKHSATITDTTIELEPEKADQKAVAYLTFPKDAMLFSAMPEAHDRGARASLSARYPDGREELLLDLPKYDFNWLRDYDFAEPKLIPAGTKLVARFTYDNSERNQANPDPKATVTSGEQVNQELFTMRLGYRWADETLEHRTSEYDELLMASRRTGMLDDNLDGVVDAQEAKRKN